VDARRVVTGRDGYARAVFVSDGRVAPVTVSLLPASTSHRLSGRDSTLNAPDNPSRRAAPRSFPWAGSGSGPAPTSLTEAPAPPDLDPDASFVEFEQQRPHMNTSATIERDSGAQSVLNPGDTSVQNGARLRSPDAGNEPAVVAAALIATNDQHVH
jgi:hypothetical protein